MNISVSEMNPCGDARNETAKSLPLCKAVPRGINSPEFNCARTMCMNSKRRKIRDCLSHGERRSRPSVTTVPDRWSSVRARTTEFGLSGRSEHYARIRLTADSCFLRGVALATVGRRNRYVRTDIPSMALCVTCSGFQHVAHDNGRIEHVRIRIGRYRMVDEENVTAVR